MPLEATMICMDNSEWSRNGDFAPSRWDSQQDAATIIAESKTRQNPESTVGVLSMAGKRVELHLTQTNEIGDLINCIGNIQINGNSNCLKAIKIAQLSLKHRQNKAQRQRIIVFVGHPLDGNEEDFEDVGMRLKKNNVSIDVINFAHPDNVSRLQTLVSAANQGGEDVPTCHFLDVPEGVTHITDVLITSPILQSEEMMQGAADGGAAAGGGEFAGLGIDPNMDPELAMALRLSMEEARANESQAANADPAPAQEAAGGANAAAGTQPGLAAANQDNDDMYGDDGQDEDAALQEALELSRVPEKPDQAAAATKAAEEAPKKEDEKKPTAADVNIDEDFMNDVMNDLGIDMNDDDAANKGADKDKDGSKKDGDDKK